MYLHPFACDFKHDLSSPLVRHQLSTRWRWDVRFGKLAGWQGIFFSLRSPPCVPWVSIGKFSLMVWSSLLQLHVGTWQHLSACNSGNDGRLSVAHTAENIYSQFRSGEKLISANEALWFIHPNTSSCRGIIAGTIWLIQCKVLPNGRMKLIGCCATDSRDDEKKKMCILSLKFRILGSDVLEAFKEKHCKYRLSQRQFSLVHKSVGISRSLVQAMWQSPVN